MLIKVIPVWDEVCESNGGISVFAVVASFLSGVITVTPPTKAEYKDPTSIFNPLAP